MENKQTVLTMPAAIIVAAAIIAIAIIWTHKPASAPTSGTSKSLPEVSMRPIDPKTDHILGDPNAPVKIVEYSDPSCPYCKVFTPTMEKIMDNYGASGKVAWVYRHFPLDKPDENGNVLHVNAGHEAEAMECAGYLGGNEKFWAYLKRLYDVTPSVTPSTPQGLDQKQLPEIAKYVGLDPVAFNDCLSSGRFKDKVNTDYTDGINAGVQGTPYSILVTPSGNDIPISGAQPYSVFQTAIDTLIAPPTQ